MKAVIFINRCDPFRNVSRFKVFCVFCVSLMNMTTGVDGRDISNLNRTSVEYVTVQD